jgi:hypothetical protein
LKRTCAQYSARAPYNGIYRIFSFENGPDFLTSRLVTTSKARDYQLGCIMGALLGTVTR